MKTPKQVDFESVLARMMALCSKAEHCENDIRNKIRDAALSDDDKEEIIAKLYAANFLNAARYCNAYAQDQFRFAGWGKLKIRQALRYKGLPGEDIQQALDEIPEEEYEAKLRSILETKDRSLHETNEYIRRGKLTRFAASRGFSYDEIASVLG